MFDLTDVGFVKRITVGSTDPDLLRSDEQLDQAMALVNRCLSQTPRGKIIGIERDLRTATVGEHQVVLQPVTYHIGWGRRPTWLEG